jgi:hypothetical protein
LQVRIEYVTNYDVRIVILFRGKEVASFSASANNLPIVPVRDHITCTMRVLDAMPHTITRDTPLDFYD